MALRALSLLFTVAALSACTIDTHLGSGDASSQGVYGGPHVCSIGMSQSAELSDTMSPGQPCISCHLENAPAAPTALGGTVYKGAHEPNDCIGQSSTESLRILIEIADMNDTVIQQLTVNNVGNFFTDMTPPSPYRARLVNQANGAERRMISPQYSGDCNACHTENGTTTVMGGPSAPGRILIP